MPGGGGRIRSPADALLQPDDLKQVMAVRLKSGIGNGLSLKQQRQLRQQYQELEDMREKLHILTKARHRHLEPNQLDEQPSRFVLGSRPVRRRPAAPAKLLPLEQIPATPSLSSVATPQRQAPASRLEEVAPVSVPQEETPTRVPMRRVPALDTPPLWLDGSYAVKLARLAKAKDGDLEQPSMLSREERLFHEKGLPVAVATFDKSGIHRWAARMRYSSQNNCLVMTPLGSALLSGRHGPEELDVYSVEQMGKVRSTVAQHPDPQDHRPLVSGDVEDGVHHMESQKHAECVQLTTRTGQTILLSFASQVVRDSIFEMLVEVCPHASVSYVEDEQVLESFAAGRTVHGHAVVQAGGQHRSWASSTGELCIELLQGMTREPTLLPREATKYTGGVQEEAYPDVAAVRSRRPFEAGEGLQSRGPSPAGMRRPIAGEQEVKIVAQSALWLGFRKMDSVCFEAGEARRVAAEALSAVLTSTGMAGGLRPVAAEAPSSGADPQQPLVRIFIRMLYAAAAGGVSFPQATAARAFSSKGVLQSSLTQDEQEGMRSQLLRVRPGEDDSISWAARGLEKGLADMEGPLSEVRCIARSALIRALQEQNKEVLMTSEPTDTQEALQQALLDDSELEEAAASARRQAAVALEAALSA